MIVGNSKVGHTLIDQLSKEGNNITVIEKDSSVITDLGKKIGHKILIKSIKKELKSYVYPKSVSKITMDGSPVEHEIVRSVNVYFITFFLIFTASVFIVSFDNKGLITSFTAVAATINNIGPGLELAGPTQNYASFSFPAKFTMIFDMLAGRLELFPMLMLFNPKLYVTKPLLSRKAK
ncbi:MAG: hypothetical protein K6E26_01255 [Clostridiales bacterium]|nr:hypothetical protein [Clostridiales bacterium]